MDATHGNVMRPKGLANPGTPSLPLSLPLDQHTLNTINSSKNRANHPNSEGNLSTINPEDINPLNQNLPKDQGDLSDNDSSHSSDMETESEQFDDLDADFKTVQNRKRRRQSQSSNGSSPTFKTPKIPPIVVDEPGNWQSLIYELKGTGATFTSKFAGHLLRIYANDTKDFRLLQTHLSKAKKNYHTFSLPEEKEVKVVVRGLRKDTPTSEITKALGRMGFSVTHATPFTKPDQEFKRVATNTFLIKIKKTQNWESIWEVNSLLEIQVTMERFTPRNTIPQCYNCQRFGHSSFNCHLPARCVKCAGPHLGKECTIRESLPHPKCANCDGPHVASYRGCPAHKAALQTSSRRGSPKQPIKPIPAKGQQPLRTIHSELPSTPTNNQASAIATQSNILPISLPATAPVTQAQPSTSTTLMPRANNPHVQTKPLPKSQKSKIPTPKKKKNKASKPNHSVRTVQREPFQPIQHSSPTKNYTPTPIPIPKTDTPNNGVISVESLLRWIMSVLPILINSDNLSPTAILTTLLTSLQQTLQNGQTN